MKIEMRLFMETVDDDEPLTEEQWKKELHSITQQITYQIEKDFKAFVKNVDGEVALESEGQWIWKKKV